MYLLKEGGDLDGVQQNLAFVVLRVPFSGSSCF